MTKIKTCFICTTRLQAPNTDYCSPVCQQIGERVKQKPTQSTN